MNPDKACKLILSYPASFVRRAVTAALDFIYPPQCAACDNRCSEGAFLCARCRETLSNTGKSWPSEGVPSGSHAVNSAGTRSTELDFPYLHGKCEIDSIYSGWDASSTLVMLIHRMKYSHAPGTARFLGMRMAEQIRPEVSVWRDATVIPVPLHPVRRRERGHNQSLCLARGLVDRLPVKLMSRGLKRRKQTVSQTRLSAGERQRNVADVFEWSPRVECPEKILLFDDVVTTGATVNACARILKQAGAGCVTVLCCLRPELRNENML